MPPSPSRRAPATLPNITELRQALDYGDLHLIRCSTFSDDVRAYRKKFITSNGTSGPDLYDWRDPEHQAGLKEMTRAYLDRDKNGLLFWPDDPSAANFNKLQYSEDRQLIENLVRQLFFRMNQQQYRNSKYKGKDKPVPPVFTPRGTSAHNPIILDDSDGPDETNPFGQRVRVKTEPSPHPLHIYDVPLSPEPTTPPGGSINGPTSNPTPNPPNPQSTPKPAQASPRKHAAPAGSGSSPRRQAKRPRPQSKSPAKAGDGVGAKGVTPSAARRRTSNRPEAASPKPPENTIPSTEQDPNWGIRVVAISGSTVTFQRSPTHHSDGQDVTTTQEKTTSPPLINSPAITPPSPIPPPQDGPPQDGANPPAAEAAYRPQKPDPLPTPAPSAAEDATTSNVKHDPRRSQTVEAGKSPAPGSRPRIEFLYRLVLSRQPVYSYRKFTPSRKLEETSFREFVDEFKLPREARSFVFTVEGPGLRAIEDISSGDEVSFDALRRQIKKAIRSQLAGRAAKTPLIFEMEVEPITGESAAREEEVDDDTDFII